MPIPPGKDQWFAVQVLSGQEQKVHDNMAKRIKTEEMSDLIYEVLVPTERVSEIKRGKKTETTRKLMPGYIIVNMHLLDDNSQLVSRTWYFVRETPGVLGFAGTRDRPVPMPRHEIDTLLQQVKGADEKVKPKVSFEVGEIVKVADGPFQNQSGVVEEIDPERGRLRVSVNIFGRAAPVDLEYWQVERGYCENSKFEIRNSKQELAINVSTKILRAWRAKSFELLISNFEFPISHHG
jgi:transcriptional antiterminator NusG